MKQATEYLLFTEIPRFAAILDFQEDPDNRPKHPRHYRIQVTDEKLPEILHREVCRIRRLVENNNNDNMQGINIRHLGRLRAKVTTQTWREVLLVEIVARVVKNIIREKLRLQMEKVCILSTPPVFLTIILAETPRLGALS